MVNSEETDDLDDIPDEFEIETASGDKIPYFNSSNKPIDERIKDKGIENTNVAARRRLETIIEERALKSSICDELYNPGKKKD